MEPQRKLLQTVRIALLVSIALYVFIGERIGRSTQSTPDRNVYFAITLFAITTVGMTFAVWRLFVLRSEVILADQPEDTAALKRWRTGYIITYTLCETVALFGFGGCTLLRCGLRPHAALQPAPASNHVAADALVCVQIKPILATRFRLCLDVAACQALLFQILLVVILGFEELYRRHNLGDDGLAEAS